MPKQNQSNSGTPKNQGNPTKACELIDHPVQARENGLSVLLQSWLSQVETCQASKRPYQRVRVDLLLGAEQVRVHRGRLVVQRLEKVLGMELPHRVRRVLALVGVHDVRGNGHLWEM